MRHALTFLATALIASISFVAASEEPQDSDVTCARLELLETKGTTVKDLQAQSPPAFVVGSETCAFPGQGAAVSSALQPLYLELVSLLHERGLSDTAVFTIAVFNGDGSLDQFYFNNVPTQLESSACQLVEDFAAEFVYPLEPSGPFNQCGTLRIP
jgi:hypothetical protein